MSKCTPLLPLNLCPSTSVPQFTSFILPYLLPPSHVAYSYIGTPSNASPWTGAANANASPQHGSVLLSAEEAADEPPSGCRQHAPSQLISPSPTALLTTTSDIPTIMMPAATEGPSLYISRHKPTQVKHSTLSALWNRFIQFSMLCSSAILIR